MNDYEIITLYFERDENAISETAKKYGACVLLPCILPYGTI